MSLTDFESFYLYIYLVWTLGLQLGRRSSFWGNVARFVQLSFYGQAETTLASCNVFLGHLSRALLNIKCIYFKEPLAKL